MTLEKGFNQLEDKLVESSALTTTEPPLILSIATGVGAGRLEEYFGRGTIWVPTPLNLVSQSSLCSH
jgi:hypothetical protein